MDVHDYRLNRRTYAEAVGVQDAAIGRLLDWLRRQELLEGAVVVLTADHGERLGESHALAGANFHMGNPAFETVLRVPLIIWPTAPSGMPPLVRGEDLFDVVAAIAGVDGPRGRVLTNDELLLTEPAYLTYRSDRWKSFRRRRDQKLFLFDIDADPGESNNVAAAQPEIAAMHRERIAKLTNRLGTTKNADAEISREDRKRLKALGYLE